MHKLFIAASAAFATLALGPANAGDRSWKVGNYQYHLYYGELDMNSAAGRATMLGRVARAAGKLCAERLDRNECVAATIEQATRAKGGTSLKLALSERDAVHYAAR
ncbi:UrcA family protein [Sphingomonas sp. QA11]|uniref:UrcA family protein n=1 Tax=Sphingomonas sp. QA11 TaxID=2950605 RepID=UPI002349A7B2|nr:UrcA family protein [Sphingomonas sp. QA11]WCM28163.1 UrcA family protein [Sphingomonas sp. QA11]